MSANNSGETAKESIIDLSQQSLDSLPSDIETPDYDRSQVKTGIVHIGPGAFFRGHQAVYIDDVLKEGDLRWGICAVSLKSTSMRDALEKQDYLYSVVRQFASGDSARVIGSIKKAMVAYEDPQAVIDQMADPDIKLVTMTVTQKGYYYDGKSGQLDFDHPDIKQCLDETSDPVSTVGYLVAALDKRMKDGTAPFTVMSCDNLPGNGDVLRNVVLAYAGQKSKELRKWISENVAFPNTMVDRIVPQTTDAEIDKIAQDFNISDSWPIYTEPFRQWIIENKSSNDMPDIEESGALIVDDVIPFELMKIRILNGAHMALGPVGFLIGYDHSNTALMDSDVESFVDGFIDEAIATLGPVPGIDIQDYKQDIIDRISNMPDDLTRLARNGSQKVQSRFLSPLKDAIAKDTPYDHIAFAVAGWMEYLKGFNADGQAFDINDGEGVRMGLQDIARNNNGDPHPLLAVREIFGPDLSSHKAFIEKVEKALQSIEQDGMLTALRQFNDRIAQDPPQQSPDTKPEPRP